MAGRKPKPAQLHKLHGNPGKDKRKSIEHVKAEPTLPLPPVPDWGDNNEKILFKKYWYELSHQLYAMRLLTELDIMAFEMLVTAYTKWQIAESKTTSDFTAKSIYRIAGQYQQQLFKLLVEFGLTPSSRSKIKLPHEEKDDFDKFQMEEPKTKKKEARK